MNITITAHDLRMVRKAITDKADAAAEKFGRDDPEAVRYDALLDRLPEPLDELWLGVDRDIADAIDETYAYLPEPNDVHTTQDNVHGPSTREMTPEEQNQDRIAEARHEEGM